MLRKGIVERQIEDMARMIGKLLKLIEDEQTKLIDEDETSEAMELLQSSCRELTGINWSLVQTLPTESLLQFLTTGGILDAGRAATMAVLLHEYGKREEAKGNTQVARSRYQTAFLLLRAAMEKESLLTTPDFQSRRADLLRRLMMSPPAR